MSQIKSLSGVPIPVIQTILGDLFEESRGFSFVYVSIGGKWNEAQVHFTERHRNTNADLQMYPQFLRQRPKEDRKIGVIIIDDFRNKEAFEKNRLLVQRQVLDENASILMIDHCFTRLSLTSFTTYLLELFRKYSIDNKCCMICNYVKHKYSANSIEMRAEEMIPVTIQTILDQSDFHSCFFEWFGYRYFLYNLVYNYKYARSVISPFYYELDDFIKHKLNKQQVIVVQDAHFINMLDNVYSIASGHLRSLKTSFVEQGLIHVVDHST